MLPAAAAAANGDPSLILFFLQCLSECREAISKDLGIPAENIELSMGMSGDFENAVSIFSTGCLRQHYACKSLLS